MASDIRKYYLRPTWFRLHPNLTTPPCAPSSCSPNCTSSCQFGHIEDLAGYWIGGLPVYQAGGPPLDFEKTGGSLWGLRGDVGETWHCHKEKTSDIRGPLRSPSADGGKPGEKRDQEEPVALLFASHSFGPRTGRNYERLPGPYTPGSYMHSSVPAGGIGNLG